MADSTTASASPVTPSTPTYTYNLDVAGAADRIVRFINELQESASASSDEVTNPDQVRIASYLDAIDSYHAWVLAQPELDITTKIESTYPLDALPALVNVDNESIEDLIRMMQLTWRELTAGRSSAMPAGYNKYDSSRLKANTAKMRDFLQSYIQKVDPVDLPESGPQFPHAPQGNAGV